MVGSFARSRATRTRRRQRERGPCYVSLMPIAKLVPSPIADDEHADAVLELAFLMSAVDGHLADEELAAFRELVPLVRGREAKAEEIDTLLGGFVMGTHDSGVDGRIREVAKAIPTELRETAFKLAIGLSLVDHDENESEYGLVGMLATSLGIADRAVALAAEARAALED